MMETLKKDVISLVKKPGKIQHVNYNVVLLHPNFTILPSLLLFSLHSFFMIHKYC